MLAESRSKDRALRACVQTSKQWQATQILLSKKLINGLDIKEPQEIQCFQLSHPLFAGNRTERLLTSVTLNIAT